MSKVTKKLIKFLKVLRKEERNSNYRLSYWGYTCNGLTSLGCEAIDALLDEYKKSLKKDG